MSVEAAIILSVLGLMVLAAVIEHYRYGPLPRVPKFPKEKS